MYPKARTDALIVEELDGETLVYDRKTDKAHCLNPTAAFVWRHSDGKTSAVAMARTLERELGAPVDHDVIVLALKQLDRAHLLTERLGRTAGARISRRELARKLAVAVALPLVATIVAPRAADAATCFTTTADCNAGVAGSPGCCCTSNRKICVSKGCGGVAC